MQPCQRLLGANPNHIISNAKGEEDMCEYCENRGDEENKLIDETMRIYDTELSIWCDCGRVIDVEIAYCPMCGRELEDDF